MTSKPEDPRRRCERLTRENLRLRDQLDFCRRQIATLTASVKNLRESKKAAQEKYNEELAQKDTIIEKLKFELERANARLNHDGTNTGTPTSQTRAGQQKAVPNSRRSSARRKGAPDGHEKSSLQPVSDSEVTDTVDHTLPDGSGCPRCGSADCIPTGESEVKYEYDVQIKVVRKKHRFFYYICKQCRKVFRSLIPPNLKEKAQYGSALQALLLSLTNTVNAAMNKAAMFLAGITGGALTPCEGYIAKLQSRAAKALRKFRVELKSVLISRSLVYWDDTVIFILQKRACFRFYGDEHIAYYTAHEHKNMESLEADNVLCVLTEDIIVMHDHNTVNYNEKFRFENIECNQHLQRDCQKNADDTRHIWSLELKELISKTIMERNDAIARGEKAFDAEYVKAFYRRVDECLEKGRAENKAEPEIYGADFERALINRIEKYRRNYFMWLEDFSLPTTNNLSERGLRGIKSHMKISGQFESEKAADNHALIRSYIETCRRNGINEIQALQRLCDGNPYTVEEIFQATPA